MKPSDHLLQLLQNAWVAAAAGTAATERHRMAISGSLTLVNGSMASFRAPERALIATSELYLEYGPAGGVAGMLGMAVKVTAEAWACDATLAKGRPVHASEFYGDLAGG